MKTCILQENAEYVKFCVQIIWRVVHKIIAPIAIASKTENFIKAYLSYSVSDFIQIFANLFYSVVALI